MPELVLDLQLVSIESLLKLDECLKLILGLPAQRQLLLERLERVLKVQDLLAEIVAARIMCLFCIWNRVHKVEVFPIIREDFVLIATACVLTILVLLIKKGVALGLAVEGKARDLLC